MKNKFIEWVKQTGAAILTILLALVIGGILVQVSGNNPFEAYESLFSGAFGSKQRISEVFVKMIPLTIIALGTSVAFKAQLWNIGGDGQFIIGAFLATVLGLYSGLPAVLVMPLSILLAMAGGALWCGIAGWLKVKFNANEVITTLMLNYIATCFLSFLMYGPMMDPDGDLPQSANLALKYRAAQFSSDLRIHAGIFMLLVLVIIMAFFWRSNIGFRIDLVGQGKKVSTYAGTSVGKTVLITMMISGAFAGLAGWNEVYGVQYKLMEGLGRGYGNIAVVIALLGGLNPIGITIAGFFFSALLVGGATMQRMTDVPYSVVEVIQGLIIVFIIARTAIHFGKNGSLVKRRKAHAK